MPGHKEITTVTDLPFVHTNHCLAPGAVAEEAPRLQEAVESSDIRLKLATELARDLEALFAEPDISRHASNPEETATGGAVIMEPERRSMRAVWGVPGSVPWETLTLWPKSGSPNSRGGTRTSWGRCNWPAARWQN